MDLFVAVVYKSRMKIISGVLGGQSIPHKPSPKLRPTSDKVKEAIFDQLEAKWIVDWSSVTVLDLFAGTGSFGFEALSRGTEKAVFVDHHLSTVRQLEETSEQFEVRERSEILCKGALEAIRWLFKRGDKFDIIFLDPPYREDWVLATLSVLQTSPLMKRKGLVIAEHDKREIISLSASLWKPEGSRKYGDTMVTLLTPAGI